MIMLLTGIEFTNEPKNERLVDLREGAKDLYCTIHVLVHH